MMFVGDFHISRYGESISFGEKKGLDEILGNAFFPLFKSEWTVDSMEFLCNRDQ